MEMATINNNNEMKSKEKYFIRPGFCLFFQINHSYISNGKDSIYLCSYKIKLISFQSVDFHFIQICYFCPEL